MKECCICYSKKRDNLFIKKSCCVYDICLLCYKELKVKTCPICKTDTICKEINITSKQYITDVLKIKLPRCGCITKLYGTPCKNYIYPPFKTCIIHRKNKGTDYYEICNKILKDIIFKHYFNNNKIENLRKFYYLYEEFNNKINNYDNFLFYTSNENIITKIINLNRVFKIKN